jgi:hypothetical protein
MRPTILLLCGLLALLFSACQQPVVVYADPWLGDYAEQMRKEFTKQHPDTQVELRLLSSEVIAWHIRYGQPIDIFLCMGPELLDSMALQDEVSARFVLGDESIALAKVIGADQTAYYQTAGCVALEATHRPARRWTEEWFHDPHSDALAVPACKVYADFQPQMAEQLLHGWVSQAFVPASFARRHPERLQVVAEGPLHRGGYTALRMKHGASSTQADAFFQFLQQEKSLKVLAKQKLNR